MESNTKGSHIRNTKNRVLILNILEQSGPLTMDEIFMKAKERNGKLSISTVYRACEAMAQTGVIQKTNLMDDGKMRYEYLSQEHMHHAICVSCHKIIPIDDCPFGDFDRLMLDKYDFTVQKHRLEIYGICRDCQKKK